jgi:hypothetical protein
MHGEHFDYKAAIAGRVHRRRDALNQAIAEFPQPL